MIKRDLELVQGDDYAAADSRALLFTGAGENWPDLSTATFSLVVGIPGAEGVVFTASGSRTVVEGLQHITVPLTATDTNKLAEGANANDYALRATLSSRTLTLAAGAITTRGKIV